MPKNVSGPPLAAIRLSPRGVARLKSGHPWVYRSDLIGCEQVEPGALVRVNDGKGKFLGTAAYSSSSQIAIRMLGREEIAELPSLVAQRIRAAVAYRKPLVHGSNAFRLVFSEADFLPGLIIDKYNDVLSVQILTQAMDAESVRGAVIETLVSELAPAGIVERVDARIRDLEQLPARESALLWGKKSATIFAMNGTLAGATNGVTSGAAESRDNNAVRFHYDGLEGQKTGGFLDQRENYAAAARYAQGDALDVFCYQGGFALHLARRCSRVSGVDSSRPALEIADKNAALNGHDLEWIEANAFDLLRDYAAAGNRYGTVVLDPPAFAKTKRDVEKALRGYKELNLRAIKMLQSGGTLVTCSCSFHVSLEEFLKAVGEAAADAHRSLRILEVRGAAQDHPALLNAPETNYLKCLILHVND